MFDLRFLYFYEMEDTFRLSPGKGALIPFGLSELPHRSSLKKVLKEPLWHMLLFNEALRCDFQQFIVLKNFPIGKISGSFCVPRPSSATSPSTSPQKQRVSIVSSGVNNTRATGDNDDHSSCTTSAAKAMRESEDAISIDGLSVRFCLWLSKQRWKSAADRWLEVQHSFRLFAEEAPDAVERHLAYQSKHHREELTPYYRVHNVSFKNEPVVSYISLGSLMRNVKVSMAVDKWWDDAPKTSSAAGNYSYVLTSTFIHIHIIAQTAVLCSPLVISEEHLRVMKALAEVDLRSLASGDSAFPQGMGKAHFCSAVLMMIEPMMETTSMEERIHALEALREVVFDGQGIVKRINFTTQIESFEKNSSHCSCGHEEGELSGVSEVATNVSSRAVRLLQEEKAVEVTNKELRRVVDQLDVAETGFSSPNLDYFRAKEASSTFEANSSVPKWRMELRKRRQHLLQAAQSGGTRLHIQRREIPHHSGDMSFSLERVMLERLTQNIEAGKRDPNRAAVVKYASSDVIPPQAVSMFVKRHPSVVDSFRNAVRLAGADEPIRGAQLPPAGTVFSSHIQTVPSHLGTTGHTKEQRAAHRSQNFFTRRSASPMLVSRPGSAMSTREQSLSASLLAINGKMTRSGRVISTALPISHTPFHHTQRK